MRFYWMDCTMNSLLKDSNIKNIEIKYNSGSMELSRYEVYWYNRWIGTMNYHCREELWQLIDHPYGMLNGTGFKYKCGYELDYIVEYLIIGATAHFL